MFTRMVETNVKPNSLNELNSKLRTEVEHTFRKQPGFIDLITLVSTENPSRVISLSFWNTQEDAERYNRETFPKIKQLIQPYITGTPTVHTFTVETSTTHKIGVGKAAA